MMEEKITETPLQVAPLEPKPQLKSGKEKPWLKIVVSSTAGLIFAGGLVFAGYWYGTSLKLKTQSSKPQLKTQNLTPAQAPIVSPKPEETADWKTYTNTTGGYTIRYPNEWIYRTTASNVYFTPVLADLPEENTSDYAPISVDVRNVLIPEHTRDQLNNYKETAIAVGDIVVKRVSGVFKETNMYAGIGLDQAMVKYKDRFYYLIHYDGKGNFKQIFDQMLSTFKFLPSGEASQGGGVYCVKKGTGEKMSVAEAREIARTSGCVGEKGFKESHFCNEDTGTWWIDLDIEKQGCNPACVINVSTKKAEINWRCTGLVPQ